MKYTPETIGEAILAHIKANFGTQRAAADAFGCGHTFLNQVVHGERRPSDTMLQAIGFRHVEAWLPADCALPCGALPLRKDSHD